ncbi:homeobox protein CDX-1 isoform X2 [Neocloeon triangulifer]|uniref:homeobox protein CDX-1 isoform X2 n=1 Tax=Neocloeon triangulifer TaxID=2078957 RepID=UPI00286EC0AC|nr:homeobox protein CDX-1 isoform X2 [Neocloeon triangulifer]
MSYYNLAMFSNSHHPRGAQAHPSAAAAAAYFGYGGYPQHQHFGPQPHYHYSAAAVAAAAAAQAASSPGPAELSACGGLLAPSPDNPVPSPSGYSQQQSFELAASAAPLAASSSPSWHGASPIYASSCARHYDDWPPNAANAVAIAGPAHSPNSPGGAYKFSSSLEFQQCPPPPPPPQPQDLSQLGAAPGAGGQHPSPADSGLAGSSDGVSSSAGSPQLHAANLRPASERSPYEWMKKPSYHNQPTPGKTRTKDKYRVVYSDHQRLELEKEFHYSRYITIRRKSELATTLGLSERQVKIWFQNRRAKERKQVKKRDEIIAKEKMEAVVQLQHPLM